MAKRKIRTFAPKASMTRAQKRDAGLLVSTGHPQRLGSAGVHDTRPKGSRDRSNARRNAIAFERSLY